MTRKREYLDYVADIQDALQNISQFIVGMTWAQFGDHERISLDGNAFIYRFGCW